MKRTELVRELVALYDVIPGNASSYHICDMLLRRAERLGMNYTVLEHFDSFELRIISHFEPEEEESWDDL
jgi:hypothetical protein